MEMEDLPIKQRIVLTVIQQNEPMSVSEISDKLDTSRQRVDYHIEPLEKQSLLLRTENDKFVAQDPFYDSELFDEMIEKMEPLFNRFIHEGVVHNESDWDGMVKNNVKLFIDFIGHLTTGIELNGNGVEREDQEATQIEK